MNAIASTTVPAAIASCGIHSGVASLPVEMSWKLFDCHDSRQAYQADSTASAVAAACSPQVTRR